MHAVTMDAFRPHEGARASFAAVAEDCLDDVYGYLLYLTRNPTVAEDLTADTFETALRRWRRFNPRRGTPRAWLLATARSIALDWFRAEARRRRREERAQDTTRSAAHDENLGEGFSPALEDGLRALSAGEREVVALRVVLDLDGAEAALLLGISATAVSTRLKRALDKLEERMRDHDRVA